MEKGGGRGGNRPKVLRRKREGRSSSLGEKVPSPTDRKKKEKVWLERFTGEGKRKGSRIQNGSRIFVMKKKKGKAGGEHSQKREKRRLRQIEDRPLPREGKRKGGKEAGELADFLKKKEKRGRKMIFAARQNQRSAHLARRRKGKRGERPSKRRIMRKGEKKASAPEV